MTKGLYTDFRPHGYVRTNRQGEAWPLSDIATVVELHPRGTYVTSVVMGRTGGSIQTFKTRLRTKDRGCGPYETPYSVRKRWSEGVEPVPLDGARQNKPWSEAELLKLRNAAMDTGPMDVEILARKLERSVDSVAQRMIGDGMISGPDLYERMRLHLKPE